MICLSFNNDSPSMPSTLPPPLEIYNTELPINLMEEIVSEIPTSVKLTKTFDDEDNNDQFVHPTVVNRNVVYEALDYDGQPKNTSSELNTLFNNVAGTETNDVNWDNMFDSELFDDVTGNAINKEVCDGPNLSDAMFPKEHRNEITEMGFNENSYKICDNKPKLFHDVAETNLSKEVYGKSNISDVITLNQHNKNFTTTNLNEECSKKRKTNNTASTRKPKKAKHQGVVLVETIEKSNDITELIPKSNFRKQKYTKTVKKWLNDLELYNHINKDVAIENTENIKVNETKTNKQESGRNTAVNSINKPKITIDKSSKTPYKKVIQAQLANKDGIMKFSKPKTEAEQTGKGIADPKVVRDKKTKAPKKFVPPVKSQIPVKDIEYEIIIVDDTNIDKYVNEINCVGEREIIAILIYR